MRHIQTLQVKTDANASLSGTQTEVGGTELVIDTTVAASQTDSLIACAFDKDTLRSVIIVADKDCTLETNSGSAPGNTIALKANVPLIWNASSGYFANPFAAADVTAFYLTTGTSSTRFQARILNT